MTLGPLMVDVAGTELTAEDRRVLAEPLVGSVILFSRNFESIGQLEALVREIRAVRSPPLLVTVDHEGGRVQRFRDGFTVLPPQRAIGRVYDLDAEAGRRLAWQCGWLLAAELERAMAICSACLMPHANNSHALRSAPRCTISSTDCATKSPRVAAACNWFAMNSPPRF
jgi:beta-N-acetylhexosaminidase